MSSFDIHLTEMSKSKALTYGIMCALSLYKKGCLILQSILMG